MDLINANVPPSEIERIITCGYRRAMKDREIAYEMRCFGSSETYYLRHRSCSAISDLYSLDPNTVAVHLGAFNGTDGSAGGAPLLIDIDVTDYKAYCGCDCSSNKTTCRQCWPYVQAAMFVISTMLEVSFGVTRDQQNWFYSGNRGVHCHVFDEQFLTMTDAQRSGIVRLLDPSMSPVKQPFFRKAWPLFRAHFDEHIAPVHGEVIKSVLETTTLGEQEMIKCAWPKLDTHVTGHRTHMIRLPLTRHPSSQRFSCQIQCSTVDMLAWWPPFMRAPSIDPSPVSLSP